MKWFLAPSWLLIALSLGLVGCEYGSDLKAQVPVIEFEVEVPESLSIEAVEAEVEQDYGSVNKLVENIEEETSLLDFLGL